MEVTPQFIYFLKLAKLRSITVYSMRAYGVDNETMMFNSTEDELIQKYRFNHAELGMVKRGS